MINIHLDNIFVNYNVYNEQSIKKDIFNKLIGGEIKYSKSHIIIQALSNISLDISHGDRVGLIGNNGSGKSTLLRVLAGIIEPAAGTIKLNGSVNSLLDINYGLNFNATGIENITMRCALMGIPLKHIPAKIDEIIKFSELGDFIHLPIRTYSSGMLVRLSFSIVTSINSDILLIDEWLSAGDSEFNKKALLKLESLIHNTSIIVMASHDKEILNKFSNRIIILDKGRLVKD